MGITPAPGTAVGGRTSLAILPFSNASREPEAEYLGDGLTENLIEQLSRLRALQVMARATVFRFLQHGDLPAFKVGNKTVVYARDVKKLVHARDRGAT